MTKVVADFDEMFSIAKEMGDIAKELSSALGAMDEVVTSVSSGNNSWIGNDSYNFSTNASAYINNCRMVESSLMECAGNISDNASQYKERYESSFEMLG